MKWVTRKQIRVNRTATCWLVRRFVDTGAKFIFVEADEVAQVEVRDDATGFDAPGAKYPHKDGQGRCSFKAMVEERLPDDPVLAEMAKIVQAADFKDQIEDHAAAMGLALISRGFPLVARDDEETIERATFLYDSLYASLEERIRG